MNIKPILMRNSTEFSDINNLLKIDESTIKKLFLLIMTLICTISLYTMDFKATDIPTGMKWSMYSSDNTLLAYITSTKSESFKIFTSDALNAIKNQLPCDFAHLVIVARALAAMQNLDDIAMLGDLYVPLDQRGKGYALALCTKVCKELFEKNIKSIVLIPVPFEYVEGKQSIIQDPSEYEIKKQALVKLYKKCGFVEAQADGITYMHCGNS